MHLLSLKEIAQDIPSQSVGASALAFIDPRVENSAALVTAVREGVEAILLDESRSGLQQIDEILRQCSGVREIHIVSHGEPGGLQLGSDWIDAETLEWQHSMLNRWQEFLTEEARIWVYGCQATAGEVGRSLLRQLHCLTGASITASQASTNCWNFL